MTWVQHRAVKSSGSGWTTAPGSRSAIGGTGVLNLDSDMRQVGEPGQSLPIMRRLMGIRRRDRDNGAEMPRPEPPEMQVGDPVALGLDRLANFLGHLRIRHAIEQDATGVTYQRDRPVGDDQRADEAGKRVHPEPTEGACQQQAENHQNRHRGVRHDMHDGGPHVVVAVMRATAMVVLFEFQFAHFSVAVVHQANPGSKGVRLRNLVTRFQISIAGLEREQLAAAIRPDGLDGDIGGRGQDVRIGTDVKTRYHVVFKDFDVKNAVAQYDTARFFVVAKTMRVTMRVIVAVTMMMPAGQ